MLRTRIITSAFFTALIVMVGFFALPARADAGATLYLNPSAGTFEVGSTFTVFVMLDTGGQAVNAVEAHLRFPPDKLQIVSSAPNEKSIMQIWVKPPTYSNAEGTVQFQGAIPNPGIDTSSGLVSALTFRVREAGTGEVGFGDESRVFLNDGKATNILTKTSGGIYAFTVPPPQGPFVVSRTNPDQGKWYRSEFVQFEWAPPLDIEGYSYALDDNFDSSPDDISEGTSTRIAYNNLADGIYYFHIRALRQNVWGGVTTYGIKIDRTEPARFSPDILPDKVTSTRMPIIMFSTTDNLSGIDHYELAVFPLDGADPSHKELPLFFEVSAPYIPHLDIGTYQVAVRAYDKAGNYTQVQVPVRIVDRMLAVAGSKGILLGGVYVLAWPQLIIVALLILLAIVSIYHFIGDVYSKVRRRRIVQS